MAQNLVVQKVVGMDCVWVDPMVDWKVVKMVDLLVDQLVDMSDNNLVVKMVDKMVFQTVLPLVDPLDIWKVG